MLGVTVAYCTSSTKELFDSTTRSNLIEMDGLIDHCKNTGCDFKCCDFGQEGYIVAFPNELKGKDTKHLQVIGETEHGAMKVRCFAKDRKTCDGGYKPIQCRIFPLWIGKEVMRSSRCPLHNKHLTEHIAYAVDLVSNYPMDIKDFKKNTLVNKYIPYQPNVEVLNRSVHFDIVAMERSHLNNPKECLRSEEHIITESLNSGCSVGVYEGEELIAFSLCYFNEYGVGYVEKCFVMQDKRGRGYQFKMLEVNKSLLEIKGVHTIYTMVSPSNWGSIKSFEKAGFKEFKKIEFKDEERLVMKYETDS